VFIASPVGVKSFLILFKHGTHMQSTILFTLVHMTHVDSAFGVGVTVAGGAGWGVYLTIVDSNALIFNFIID